MSSTAPHRIINTRELGTSVDINRIIQLSDRNTSLATWYAAQNDDVVSGVLTGLRVTVVGDVVTVSPGLALHNDGSAAYPDSPYRWIEHSAESPALTIGVGATKVSGEWMVIEISAGTTDTITTSVEVFDPVLSAFVTATLNKEVQSAPVLQVRTSGFANQFPAGVAGQIPLAYVFDTGSALTTDDRVSCRPLLRSKAPLDVSDIFVDTPAAHVNDQLIQGGGISVLTAFATTVTAEALTGRFYGHRQSFKVGKGSIFDLSDADAWENGAKSAIKELVYMYALPAPYPTGYSTLADREFVVGDNVTQQFATVQSATTSEAQIGCIVVATTSGNKPDTFDIGAQGTSFSSIVVTDVPFRNGGASVTISDPIGVYMGTFQWSFTGANIQRFDRGEARVQMNIRPRTDVRANVAQDTILAVDPRDGTETGGTSGGEVPAHGLSMRLTLDCVNGTSTLDEYVKVNADDGTWSWSFPVFQSNTPASFTFGCLYQLDISIDVNDTTIDALYTDSTNITTFEITTESYVDSIIANR